MAISLMDTQQAAAALGVSPRRVRALITAGQLPAHRVGRDWVIHPKDLAGVQFRQPGRPKTKAPKQSSKRHEKE